MKSVLVLSVWSLIPLISEPQCMNYAFMYFNQLVYNDITANFMDIRENDFSDDKDNRGYLAEKLKKLKPFFSLIFNEITKEEEVLLEE